MSTSVRSNYHHGDLRSALLDAAMEMVEAGEQFSLRAVARRADVSQTAPYRHFADREALESALAIRGFQELGSQLSLDGRPATSEEALVEFGVVYVNFALTHPGLFKLMFGQECDRENDERVLASTTTHYSPTHCAKSSHTPTTTTSPRHCGLSSTVSPSSTSTESFPLIPTTTSRRACEPRSPRCGPVCRWCEMTTRILHVVTNVAHYENPEHPTGLWLSELTHAWHVFEEHGLGRRSSAPQADLLRWSLVP